MDGLIAVLGRMEQIFRRLEPFIAVPPPQSMKNINEKILLVVLSILTSVTEEIKWGRASKFTSGRHFTIYLPLIRKVPEKVDGEECR
jgi:hypothetical protein